MPTKAELISDAMSTQDSNWNKQNPAGVDPEVMADIGFTPFEDMPGIIDDIRKEPPKLATYGQVAVQGAEKPPIPQNVRDMAAESRQRQAQHPDAITAARRRRNLYGSSNN